jgi:two-component system, LuxR family, sensor kinase FixL
LRVLANQVIIQLELRYALKIADETAKQRDGLIVKLTESNMELDRFAYVASHDMQEPLRMITNFGDLLKTEYADKIGAEGEEYIGLITNSAGRMQDMVRDLLENARLGSSSAKLESVNANNALENALEHLSVIIKETGSSITHDDLPEIKANKLQFMRLLQNLVGNGLKYQKEGIKPQIHVGVKDTGDFFEFSVLDNGIGIAPEHLELIFKPFIRLHTWEEYQGTGMGLAVCKKIVENHGGKISVTSEPDKGTIFYFTLPKTNKEVL